MSKPPILFDLFCGAGGAGMGYMQMGFEVIGFDIEDHDNYPGQFVRADALTVMHDLATKGTWNGIRPAAVHASPPCQAYSGAQRIMNRQHPQLIEPTRKMLDRTAIPYALENVVGAPLRPDVVLCGTMFGIETYRHRVFETSFSIPRPPHPERKAPNAKMGRPASSGEFMHIVGHFSGVERAREIMGMPWATRDQLAEAIPPAYTRYVGHHLMKELEQ